jgi:hypothetical protein
MSASDHRDDCSTTTLRDVTNPKVRGAALWTAHTIMATCHVAADVISLETDWSNFRYQTLFKNSNGGYVAGCATSRNCHRLMLSTK